MTDRSRVLQNIAACDQPDQLRRYMRNAQARGAHDVYEAAFHRLIAVQPSSQIGTIAYDVWRTIHAFEELLKEERGRTTRLARTRQAIARKGEVKTVVDLVLKRTASEGFNMLQARDLLELSFEGLAVARPDEFPANVVERALDRLTAVGFDPSRACRYWNPQLG